ncbi:hypothetical protein K466DRAFT_546052 [Polyporus arcularius HHB13444]|uniref:Required for respiratory growth protein 9, mitochondrial n=1 Tax=Polyporus arcularius HHB13444 TaxID=1314778 RepID=A0A5C3PGZ3_9APHY|nr:hypothetical protein K466DRAFT_546052 [Polyporus arcularius HHB13444]
MLSTTLRSIFPQKSPARHTLINLYSTVADLTRTHWKTGAHPAPKSLVEKEDDDEDWPAPQKEMHPSLEAELADAEAEADESSSRPLPHRPFSKTAEKTPTPQEYRAHRETMKKKFPEGWAPPRKLSREAMVAVRHLHQVDPAAFSTPILAEKFRISKEAVRRILKSKWEPTREQKARMAAREKEARTAWKAGKRAEENRQYEQDQRRVEREEDELTLT